MNTILFNSKAIDGFRQPQLYNGRFLCSLQ
jgi:hypothetical protein